MATWRPTIVRVGATYPDMSGLVLGLQPGLEQEAPILCLALESGDTRVLVDTGLPALEWVLETRGKATMTPDEVLPTALRSATGWGPEDVDFVVNTHLHFDHCGGNRIFPNARFVVQRREYEYALRPDPGMAALFGPHLFDRSAVAYFDWLFVDGDHELFPGLQLLFTPGHTVGHQSVVFDATDGVVVYAGDAVCRLESLEQRIPPGIYLHYDDAIASLDRIRDVADYVIPSHDIAIRHCQQTGFPEVRRP